jgi:hypothetical protein
MEVALPQNFAMLLIVNYVLDQHSVSNASKIISSTVISMSVFQSVTSPFVSFVVLSIHVENVNPLLLLIKTKLVHVQTI